MHRARSCLLAALAITLATTPGWAQMVSGTDIPGFAETMDLGPGAQPPTYSVDYLGGTAPANVLWPGEQAEFAFQVRNDSGSLLEVSGKVDLIRYGTKGRPGDVWVPEMLRYARYGPVSIAVSVPVGGYQDLTVKPTVPDTLGAYALVLDLGDQGRRFITSFVRTFRADAGRVRFPQLCLDNDDPVLLTRLGAAPNRIGIGYKPTTDPDSDAWYRGMGDRLRAYHDAGLAITVEFGGGDFYHPCQPLGRPRPWLDEGGFLLDTKFDLAWLPDWDDDFREFARRFAADYGWPKGPVNGFKLWNEPWNGISISGWGADDERYREIFTAMCEGVEQARREDGVVPLLGGCDSSSNTLDKLFADGSDRYLKWLDFCSIHYQGMSPPSTVKAWLERKSEYGRVRIWDTESWVANTDDRVSTVVATNLSTGHDRAVGIYHGNVATEWHARGTRVRDGDGWKEVERSHTWSVAAAVGATMHFIGERRFRELLFRNGLPWVMVFDGRLDADVAPNPEDGTVVVIGDIGEEFGADSVLYRTARGRAEIRHKEELRAQLAALPPDATEERAKVTRALATPEPLTGARMVVRDDKRRFTLHDPYGNEIEADGGNLTIPLDHRGFFLRAERGNGNFASLLRAVREARVEGIEPLAKECLDLTDRVEREPAVRLRLTNVLNRAIRGTLRVELGELTLDKPVQRVDFRAHETKTVSLRVTKGVSVASNTYPLHLEFDAGPEDGVSEHREDLHANVIPRLSPTVDGRLDEWLDVPVQTVVESGDSAPTLQQYAWQPFKEFDTGVTGGLAHGWLAYDGQGLYFASRVADSTPDPGMPRFGAIDEDQCFYPPVAFRRAEDGSTEELRWPAGVRRFSYRKDPELPCGNAPSHDNIQLAFNVLPVAAKPWALCPPGTMPGYTGYRDTDYEYALNQVAEEYGGGVEIWPLRRPDLPDKHYYPRQPKAAGEGPVRDGRLVVRRDGDSRVCECFLPWAELRDVKTALDAGSTIKFSFRVNDNAGGGCMELSRGRSVAKRNGSFRADWVEHWANELEFGFERPDR